MPQDQTATIDFTQPPPAAIDFTQPPPVKPVSGSGFAQWMGAPPAPSYTPSPEEQAQHPVMSALAQEGQTDLNEAGARAAFGANHPWIDALADVASTAGFGAGKGATSLTALLKAGDWDGVRTLLLRSGKSAAIGSATGATIGGALGGRQGAEIGAATGGLGGLAHGALTVPPTIDQLADQKVANELALRAARVRAGVLPPAEDDIAEVLRQEFLAPQKKSGVPQNITSPKAIAPTFVPSSLPGAALSPDQIAKNALNQKVASIGAEVRAGLRPSPEEDIEDALRQEFLPKTAAQPVPQNIPLPKAATPTFVPSGTPGSPSDLVARANALQDIRDVTVNRPGWVSKLPDKFTFQRLPATSQRAIISQAISEDPIAANAVKAGTRLGSAGDLASWPAESLWSHYMKEYASPNPDKNFMQMLENEISRRGQATAAAGQVR